QPSRLTIVCPAFDPDLRQYTNDFSQENFIGNFQFGKIEDPLNPPYLLCNLCASHIMIDKDYKPVIYDFGMISGGILTDRTELTNQYVDGCHGYIDPVGARPGAWSEKCDVFSFGVVLLGLITNKVYTEEDFTSGKPSVHEWAWGEYRQQQSHSSKHNISLVHANIESELLFYPRDGTKLTNLAMQCVEYDPLKRPTMKQVVSYLLKLEIVQGHGNSLGIDQIPHGDHATDLANKLSEGFSEGNIIGDFEFGRVFRGKTAGKEVTVKIWKIPERTYVTCEYERRLWDELVLLQHPKFMSHPNMLKLVGYCFEGKQLAIVYDLKPLDTIHNLMVKDNFTWLQRIKVALGFAVLLNFLHHPVPHRIQYLVRNICAAHIILDQDGFRKLLDFGMLAGGILPERRFEKFHRRGAAGYGHYYIHGDGPLERRDDVIAFGEILLSLISKYFVNQEEYKAKLSVPGPSRSQFSLVNKTFMTERGFSSKDGIKITKLALECMEFYPSGCPEMKKVVKSLMKLHAVRNYGDEVGIKEMLS
ncbi:hypothetical protein Tsubulata_043748, partial [Turnera subulata]